MTKEEEKAMQDDHKWFMDDQQNEEARHILYAIYTYAACFCILAGLLYAEINF